VSAYDTLKTADAEESDGADALVPERLKDKIHGKGEDDKMQLLVPELKARMEEFLMANEYESLGEDERQQQKHLSLIKQHVSAQVADVSKLVAAQEKKLLLLDAKLDTTRRKMQQQFNKLSAIEGDVRKMRNMQKEKLEACLSRTASSSV